MKLVSKHHFAIILLLPCLQGCDDPDQTPDFYVQDRSEIVFEPIDLSSPYVSVRLILVGDRLDHTASDMSEEKFHVAGLGTSTFYYGDPDEEIFVGWTDCESGFRGIILLRSNLRETPCRRLALTIKFEVFQLETDIFNGFGHCAIGAESCLLRGQYATGDQHISLSFPREIFPIISDIVDEMAPQQ